MPEVLRSSPNANPNRPVGGRGEAVLVVVLGLAISVLSDGRRGTGADPPRTLAPAAWGSDHVGQPVPEFVEGNECLFCHRLDVGTQWEANHHARSVREPDADDPALAALRKSPTLAAVAAESPFVIGSRQRQRFLKPAKAYGQLELSSVEWMSAHGETPGQLIKTENPKWDAQRYGNACAGCHSTGVDPAERTFLTRSLDCSVCHGEVPGAHSKDPSLAYLSPHRKDPARVITSVCAQCHVRTGTSRSTGRPYPTNFVAGDNLFLDFQVDFSDAALAQLDPADGHILENVRAVSVQGREETTCLTCHDLHKQSTRKHHQAPPSAVCWSCHNESGSRRIRKPYAVHSRTCGY